MAANSDDNRTDIQRVTDIIAGAIVARNQNASSEMSCASTPAEAATQCNGDGKTATTAVNEANGSLDRDRRPPEEGYDSQDDQQQQPPRSQPSSDVMVVR